MDCIRSQETVTEEVRRLGTIRLSKQRRTWFIDYVDASGRRVRQFIGSGEGGKRLAKRVLAQREGEAVLGIHRLPAAQTPTFAEFAEDWLARTRARRLAPKTLDTYKGLVEKHLIPALGARRLGAITQEIVEQYLVGMAAKTRRRKKPRATAKHPGVATPSHEEKAVPVPLAAKTINHTLTLLKAILADAVEHGFVSKSPAARIKPLRAPDREDALHILQPDEIARLLEVAKEPWRTLYEVAMRGTGMRRGELLGLRWRDLDLAKGLLSVRRSLNRFRDGDHYVVREAPLKTRYSKRTIDLSPNTVQALLALPAGDDPERDYVFRSQVGGPIDPDNVDRAWKRDLTAAGLADRPFHSTRHTHASLLIAAGVHPKAIQARLGHSSITVTMDRYGHLMPSAFQGVGERVDALIKATTRQQDVQTHEREPARRLKPAS